MLEERSAAMAGAGGTNQAGTASKAGADGGDGGQGVEYTVPDCIFLDEAIPEECESLVQNPGFAKDIEGWEGENVKILVGWYPDDATDSEASGSIAVNNTLSGATVGTAPYGAWQCIPVTAGGVYDFAADFYIPKGQDPTGMAEINVYYYDTAECEGANKYSFSSDPVTKVGSWVPVRATDTAPGGIQSMFVRLVAVKQFQPMMFRVHFDNVLVRLR